MTVRPERFVVGAISGLLATVPMTALMLLGSRRFSWRSREPLPPAQITERALRIANLDDDLPRRAQLALTTTNHFAYGAAVGAVYGGLFQPRSLPQAAVTGATYGLGVWAASYLAWLPAMGLYRSAADDTAERNVLMIAAHVVWGGSLGALTCCLSAEAAPAQADTKPARMREIQRFPTEHASV